MITRDETIAFSASPPGLDRTGGRLLRKESCRVFVFTELMQLWEQVRYFLRGLKKGNTTCVGCGTLSRSPEKRFCTLLSKFA